MPIFEFKCGSCGKEFERLVFRSEEDDVKCPECGSERTTRLPSVFAACSLGSRSHTSCSSSSGSS